ncbi:MAG: methyltransferase domain-containing protein [Chloroflexi bacterium]|nr:methyltransferase domain-containing protein [Chloroflexota bacterium]
MPCRQCRGIEKFFDDREARSELKSYHKKGPSAATRQLLDAISEREVVKDKTLLDIGGGIGAIQHELLKVGARSAVSVDASSAYANVSRDEARRQGHADRITQHLGDFVELAESIEPADIVTLDRVICCYHDANNLLRRSSDRATRLLGLVYPGDGWLFRVGARLLNLGLRLRRSDFRVFVHPNSLVSAIMEGNGFRRVFYRKNLIWQVMLYERLEH